MQQYKLSQQEIKKVLRKVFLTMILMTLIISGYFFVITDMEEPSLFITMVIGVILMMGVSMFINIKWQRKLLGSYIIYIDDDHISRQQQNTPTITILFNEIQSIAKNKNGSYTVKGRNKQDQIGIFAGIENIDLLLASISKIVPITTASKIPLLQRSPLLLTILILCLTACFYISTDKMVCGVTGTILIAIMLWSFREMQKSKQIEDKVKRMSWLVFLPLMAAVARMIAVIGGFITA